MTSVANSVEGMWVVALLLAGLGVGLLLAAFALFPLQRRYEARIAIAVGERTAELEGINVRLGEHLRQLKATQARRLCRERLSVVGRLAAGVGHEINNPLAFILSNLDYAREELEEEAIASGKPCRHVLDALADAREGAERVRLIVRNLGLLGRGDGREDAPVELDSLVRAAAEMASHELGPRARVLVECEGAPPVQGDSARLGLVFVNLLLNAAQSIEPGRAADNEVRVVARTCGAGLVSVEVRDTGCGIPPELLGKIFDPFFSTRPIGQGTGLGLSVCHGIVSSLGGELTVESEPGRGSTFRVLLPEAGTSSRSPSRRVSPRRLSNSAISQV